MDAAQTRLDYYEGLVTQLQEELLAAKAELYTKSVAYEERIEALLAGIENEQVPSEKSLFEYQIEDGKAVITAYTGSYIGQLVQFRNGALVVTGQYLQIVTFIFAALVMAVFTYFAEKKKMAWLDNFSIAGSMLVGMAAAVICGMIF